jgi:hypothetical protein
MGDPLAPPRRAVARREAGDGAPARGWRVRLRAGGGGSRAGAALASDAALRIRWGEIVPLADIASAPAASRAPPQESTLSALVHPVECGACGDVIGARPRRAASTPAGEGEGRAEGADI